MAALARQVTNEEAGSWPAQLNVVPISPPVEATLRILLNSVPYLMGAAVVRQPPGNDAVVAEVGRMPWLHDRRLTTLQLPDDALPANRAVALDWPVPYQAEWVGAPPRLVISRLVSHGHTVGVLLGTLITREPLSQQTREALDLSCELIASAVANESLMSFGPPQQQTAQVEHQSFFVAPQPASKPEAEREPTLVAEPALEPEPEPVAPRQPEPERVAFRQPDPEPALIAEPEPEPELAPMPQLTVVPEPEPEIAREPEPEPIRTTQYEPPRIARVSRNDTVDLVIEEVQKNLEGAGDARSLGRVLRDAMNAITDASAFSVSLFHLALPEVAYRYKVVGPERDSTELGRQTVDDGPTCYASRHDRRWHVFARDLTMRDATEVRRREVIVLQIPMIGAGEVFGVVTLQTFRHEGFSDHELRLVAAVVEVASSRFGQVRLSGRFQPPASNVPAPVEAAAPAVLPTVAAAPPPAPAPRQRTADDVLGDLLRRCAGAGFDTAFLMGVDPGAGMLRGELVSSSDVARELDYALGISAGRFAVPLDERYNAIARAVREARIVPAPTIHEIAQPLFDWQDSLKLERLAHGGRTVTLPLIVDGQPAGALVLGPMLDDPTFSAIETIRGHVEGAAKELAELWRAAR